MVTGTSAPLSPVLTPRGRLLLAQGDDGLHPAGHR